MCRDRVRVETQADVSRPDRKRFEERLIVKYTNKGRACMKTLMKTVCHNRSAWRDVALPTST